MDGLRKPHSKRRVAARFLMIGAMSALLAGAPGAAPASATPSGGSALSASEPTAVLASTTCFAARADFHVAVGSCQNPSATVEFRVRGVCQARTTGALYTTFSQWTSSFDEAFAFCNVLLLPDFMASWSTQTRQVDPPPPPPPDLTPVINSFNCDYLGSNQFSCSLSATDWDHIRWTVLGSERPAWDNRTSVQGACSGGSNSRVSVEVDVSNSHGTTHRGVSISCTGQPK